MAESYSSCFGFGFGKEEANEEGDDGHRGGDVAGGERDVHRLHGLDAAGEQRREPAVFSVAMLVPIMRPPTFVAKLPPVPRRCSGKTLGRYSPK